MKKTKTTSSRLGPPAKRRKVDATASPKAAPPTAASTLRELPKSNRHFWKETIEEQLSQVVIDKNTYGVKRTLPKQEILSLSLNEVAAAHGRGFFLHLPSRDVWKSTPSESLTPKLRVPQTPGSEYPSLAMVDIELDQQDTAAYLQETQRGRYLKGSGMLSRLPPDTPVYAIQYAHFSNFPLYQTTPLSLVILSNTSSFYLATTQALEASLGLKKAKAGPEPAKRLTLPSQVWQDQYLMDENDGWLTAMEVTSLEGLYLRLIESMDMIEATMSAAELLEEVVPRPENPSMQGLAVPLGTPLPGGSSRPTAPSKMGLRAKANRSAAASGNDSVETAED